MKKNTNIFINSLIGKNQLKKIIIWFFKKYGEKPTIDFLEKLKEIGFLQATQAGISLGLDDLKIPKKKKSLLKETIFQLEMTNLNVSFGNLTTIEKSQRVVDYWNKTSSLLRENIIKIFQNKYPLNSLSMMAFSGARGNISQVQQLVGMRGLMADPEGSIVEFPIQSNFREGITLPEYLISCYGARKGLVDTALRTATSGYLTRKLVDVVQHLIISEIDCFTTDGLLMKNPNNLNSIVGRVLLDKHHKNIFNNVIEAKKIKNIFPFFFNETPYFYNQNSKIFLKKNQIISLSLATILYENQCEFVVRSPLTCQSPNSICQLCYGWDLAKGDLVTLGEAIGIIAAQSIGEPGTQLTMRTFHTGGVGVFSNELLKTFRAPFDGKILFPESLPGIFIRNQYGRIVFLLKYTLMKPTRVLLELHSSNSDKIYSLGEAQLLPGSILIVRQGQHIKTNEIIAQTATISQQAHKFPESLHPIQSKIDGEVFFENVLLQQKQSFFKLNNRGSFFIQDNYLKKLANNYIKLNSNNLKPIRKLLPTSHFLKDISSFWILPAQNQKEFYDVNSFIKIGDLLSVNSFLFQTNIKYPISTKLKRLNINLISYFPNLIFPISNVKHNKSIYSLVLYDKNKIKSFLVFSKILKKIKKFYWVPINWILPHYGFFILSDLYWADDINLHLKQYYKSKNAFINFGTFFFLEFHYFLLSSSFFYLFLKIFRTISKINKKTNIILINCFFENSLHSHFIKGNFNEYLYTNLLNKYNLVKTNQLKSNKLKLDYPLKKKNHFNLIKIKTNELSKIKDHFYKYQTKYQKIWTSSNNWIIALDLEKLKKLIPKSNYNLSIQKFIKLQNIRFPYFSIETQITAIEYFFSKQFVILQNRNYNYYKDKKSFLYSYNILDFENQWNYTFNDVFLFSFNKSKKTPQKLVFFKFKKLKKNSLKYKKNSKKLTKRSLKLITKIRSLILIKKSLLKKKKKKKSYIYLSLEKINQKHISPKIKIQTIRKFPNLKNNSIIAIKSPLFVKQSHSNNLFKVLPIKKVKIKTNWTNGWFYYKNFLRFEINFYNKKIFNEFFIDYIPDILKKKNMSSLSYPKGEINKNLFNWEFFQFFSYTLLPIPLSDLEKKKINIQLYKNNWIMETHKFLTGFKLSQFFGEAIHIRKKDNTQIWSSLDQKELITLKLPSSLKYLPTNIKIGRLLKTGEEFLAMNYYMPFHGKIIKLKKNQITIRPALSILGSKNGILHIKNKDLILKNQLLLTLKSFKLETQDIVQGIPKIEQLFEARDTSIENNSINIHNKLEDYFLNKLYQNFNFKIITKKNQYSLTKLPILLNNLKSIFENISKTSKHQIQKYIVDNILQAYLDQGVVISEKHVEIIVREMTDRVRVLISGSSGLLPGEIIKFNLVEQINANLIKNKQRLVYYDPIVLGITKSVLYSESFLLAASFQEVSRVLIESSINNKTDFLLGLHENIIVGQPIPTGIVPFLKV